MVLKRRIGPMLKYSTKGNYCSRVRFHRTLETITMLTTFLQRASNHLPLPWVGKLPACSCSVMLTYNHYPIIGCKRDAGFAVIAADQSTMKGSTFGTQCVLQKDLGIALYENLVFPKEFGAVLFQQ